MKTISVNIPEAFEKGLRELVVGKKLYSNRSEAIRVAIRDLLKRELYTNEEGYNPTTTNEVIVRYLEVKLSSTLSKSEQRVIRNFIKSAKNSEDEIILTV